MASFFFKNEVALRMFFRFYYMSLFCDLVLLYKNYEICETIVNVELITPKAIVERDFFHRACLWGCVAYLKNGHLIKMQLNWRNWGIRLFLDICLDELNAGQFKVKGRHIKLISQVKGMKWVRALEKISSLSFYWWAVRDPDRRQHESALTRQPAEDPGPTAPAQPSRPPAMEGARARVARPPSPSCSGGAQRGGCLAQFSWLPHDAFCFKTSSFLTLAQHRFRKTASQSWSWNCLIQ